MSKIGNSLLIHYGEFKKSTFISENKRDFAKKISPCHFAMDSANVKMLLAI